jgi:hypothetical protein
MYQLAAQRMHLHLCQADASTQAPTAAALAPQPSAGQTLLGEARDELDKLDEQAARMCKELDERTKRSWPQKLMWWRAPTPAELRLLEFLSETVLPSAALLRAGIAVSMDVAANDATIRPLREKLVAADLPYRAAYNLACYDIALAESVKRLASDSDPTTEKKIAEHLDAALLALREALSGAQARRRQELGHWALRDPALKVLRESTLPCGQGDYKACFEELLKLYAIDRPEPKQQPGAKASQPAPAPAAPAPAPGEAKPSLCRRIRSFLDEKQGSATASPS